MSVERGLWSMLVLVLLGVAAALLLEADDAYRRNRAYFRAIDRAAAGIGSDMTLAEYYRRLVAEFEDIPE